MEFIKPVDKGDKGWSVKKLVKLMVTSSAYRQSSTASQALIEKDPYNRLLARGPLFRMEAEMVRDMAPAVRGLLSTKVGGPSVFPLQPEGFWKAPYSGEKWVTSKGGDAYRRTLYTFIRRSSPFPMMLTFDATSREACTVRRVRTNTPLQAHTLLNDESAMENARALAKRASEEAEGDLRSQLTYAFRLCISRMPQNRELDRLASMDETSAWINCLQTTSVQNAVRSRERTASVLKMIAALPCTRLSIRSPRPSMNVATTLQLSDKNQESLGQMPASSFLYYEGR